MISSSELDPEQFSVSTCDGASRQIVVAGPGAGKTTVVGALVENLVEGGLDGVGSVLVLSFSRAAVHAVRQRLGQRADWMRAVDIRTIDSFAYQLVAGDGDTSIPAGFDECVALAVELLEGGSGTEQLEGVGHVVLDEAQDLGGVRAKFALKLIDALHPTCGFTVLGDPLQGIFKFKDVKDSYSWREFTRELADRGADRTVELSGSYRFSGVESRGAADLGLQLRAAEDPGKQAEIVGRFLPRLSRISIETFAGVSRRWEGSTAVLAKSNGEVLATAGKLRELGIDVALIRAAEDNSLAPWLAELARVSGTRLVDKDQFDDFISGRQDVPDGSWRTLRRLSGGSRAIALSEVSRRLRSYNVPVELLLSADRSIRISTIHKAKGLEFDNTALLNPEWLVSPARADTGYEISEAFVALTRSRERLVRLGFPDMPTLSKDRASGRWVKSGYKAWQTKGFEFRGKDTLSGLPMEGQDGLEAYLSGSVVPGDPVTLRLDPRHSNSLVPFYEVVHGPMVVARTNEIFGHDFARRIGGSRRAGRMWPEFGAGGFVDSVETVAGEMDPQSAVAGVRLGFWLGVRITGLVDIEW